MKQLLIITLIIGIFFIAGCSSTESNVIENIETEGETDLTDESTIEEIDSVLVDENDEVEIGEII